MVKIYIASSFRFKDRCQELSDILEYEGHTVPVKWWMYDFKDVGKDISDFDWYRIPDIEAVFRRNWEGVVSSDVLILVCPEKGDTKFNGANIEVGIAIANAIPTLSWGLVERSAMYYPINQCSDVVELLVKVSKI